MIPFRNGTLRSAVHPRENSDVPGADLVLESENRKANSIIGDLQEEMTVRRGDVKPMTRT